MTKQKEQRRAKIKFRVRNKISGTAERPRMSVFRSNKQIYVQIINDETATTLVAASSLGMETMPKKEQAAKVGEAIAQKAIEEACGFCNVVPIRGGTDGAQLSFRGLPCPNIFAGGLNFHGRHEFVPIQSMEKAMQTVVNICRLTAER